MLLVSLLSLQTEDLVDSSYWHLAWIKQIGRAHV